MIVHPRSEWTSHATSLNKGGDNIGWWETFRNPVGIKYYSTIADSVEIDKDPCRIFELLRHSAHSVGHSDIDYNLGVASNVAGVFSLRGLANKPSASADPILNDSYVAVYIVLGRNEKPTDVLLRNIVDARRLVLSRYPTATDVVEYQGNKYLERIFQQNLFKRDIPVGRSSIKLPQPTLIPEMKSVHVQELQEQLAYWGYYKNRVNGLYDIQTSDSVRMLAADLKDGGYYHGETDGVYSDDIHMAWLKYLEEA